jgi:predicted AlkP superfamily pyrophosphatase or phosphodiesterase
VDADTGHVIGLKRIISRGDLLQDTVEVDLNVTRNVEPELADPEWEVLLFHYLGLDHVGHSFGPHR